MSGPRKRSERPSKSKRSATRAYSKRRTSSTSGNHSDKVARKKNFQGPSAPMLVDSTKLILFNKPFNTLCQFTGEHGDSTLADFINIPGVYAAGRLDKDSEGLLLLTNDGRLQHRISHPKFKKWKTYWVQVEGAIDTQAIESLKSGVALKDGITKPAKVKLLDSKVTENKLWERIPPVRHRAKIPTSWISLSINEGKNRQVRRMTAAVGFPTLRLIRVSIDKLNLEGLKPGEHRELTL